MRTLIVTLFVVFTTAVLGVGGYLGVTNFVRTNTLIEDRKSIEAEIAGLEMEIGDFRVSSEETVNLIKELDSISNAITAAELDLKDRLSRRGSLSRSPVVKLDSAQDNEALSTYPLFLSIEGSRSAIDTFLVGLARDIFFLKLDSLELAPGSSYSKLRAWGSVSYPRTE